MAIKILIADDSLTIQKVIKMTLSNLDYELSVASSESELLNELKKNFYSIILLDFSLSDNFSGFELTKKIKKINANANVILMFSAYDTIDDSILKTNNLKNYIIKPFDAIDLIDICEKVSSDLESPKQENDEVNSLKNEENSIPLSKNNDQENISVLQDENKWIVKNNFPLEKSLMKQLCDYPIPTEINSPLSLNSANNDLLDMELPPTIPNDLSVSDNDTSPEIHLKQVPITKSNQFPNSSELEYPDLDLNTSPLKIKSKDSVVETTKPSINISELDSDEFWMEDDKGIDKNTDEIINLDSYTKSKLIPLSELKNDLKNEYDISLDSYVEIDKNNKDETGDNTSGEILKSVLENDLEEDEFWSIPSHSELESGTTTLSTNKHKEQSHSTIASIPTSLNSRNDEKLTLLNTHENEKSKQTDLNHDSKIVNLNPIIKDKEREYTIQSGQNIQKEQYLGSHNLNNREILKSMILSEVKRELPSRIKPIIEESLKAYCMDIIEKVASTMIPEIAEHLIKEELKRLESEVENKNGVGLGVEGLKNNKFNFNK